MMMMMMKPFFDHKLKGLGNLNKKYINRQYWKDKQVATEITMVLRTVLYLIDEITQRLTNKTQVAD